ncbi:putative motility protein [Rossellomorea marisflavi]|uniref:putative motility protein n=1 Tax=Rossellomorea TaxID=2837508 RepID=UPI00064E7D86|nr:putative motility protein [Rossellomorea marisflavi]KMK91369.1 polyribonucleotide nucleotidyltransferase [Rossellomorea marisflavi]MCM2604695.1 putative motility protein [Rossellomorea marisflavi]
MNLSSIMSRQVADLQHTVSLSLMKTQMATQAAQAVVMLQDMKEASHPHKGTVIDQKG